MLDLKLNELEKLLKITSGDMMVKKYMKELERVNKDPKFREYISVEQDEMMLRNAFREEGIIKAKRETAIAFLKKVPILI